MVLDAAASTSGGMLSLSVDVDERGASASSSWSRALVLAGGATAVQQDHVRSLAARQPSVQPCRQARAVQVHHRGDAVWPGLTPGRPARCASVRSSRQSAQLQTDRQTDRMLDTPTVGASTALPSMGHAFLRTENLVPVPASCFELL